MECDMSDNNALPQYVGFLGDDCRLWLYRDRDESRWKVVFEQQVSCVSEQGGEERILTVVDPKARERTLVAAKTTAEGLARRHVPSAANAPVWWRCLVE